MRQVPAQPGITASQAVAYLIIGDGRLARHLQAYFRFEALPYLTWSRTSQASPDSPDSNLRSLAAKATHILLAISDSAIEPFLKEHRFLQDKVCVHFSGALVTPLAASAHPLMTFSQLTSSQGAYSHERYLEIPFVLEKGRGSLSNLLPGLKNPSFEIQRDDKVRYHALCVMSGNFTTLLWEKTFREFAKLGLPKEVLFSYLNQITENLEASPAGTSVLTGPLVRGDQTTIEKHLAELGADPYADVYRSFVTAFEKTGSDTLPIPTEGTP